MLYALDWKEGQTLAYLIDVMPDEAQSTKPRYRIFVQSAASDPREQPLPRELLAQKNVDLAVITSGNFDNVQNYSGARLEQLNPQHVMVAHYEPFWKPIDANSIELMPILDMDELLERINEHLDNPDQVHLPMSTSILTID